VNHVRILCLVFGAGVRPVEIEAAMFLIWRAWAQDAQVVGVVLGAEARGRVGGDSMLGILFKSIEARIDVPACLEPDDGLQPPDPVVETTNYLQSLAMVGRAGFCTVAPKRAAELQQKLSAVTVLDFKLGIAPMQVGFITRSVSTADLFIGKFRDCFTSVVQHEAKNERLSSSFR
jgi:hypothetical protein